MITSYIKIAFRNLLRHKGYSFISIAGLALGLACSLSIFLHVQDELSYESQHEKGDRIYRLVTSIDGASFAGIAKVNGPWGPTALSNLPEVEQMTRFVIAGQTLFENGDKRFYETNGFYTDSTAFDVFSLRLISGSQASALVRPDGIVLTESLAKKYFGDTDPVNKVIRLDNQQSVTVTAVIRDIQPNSHFIFSFLLPMSGYKHPQRESWTQWNQYYTYLLLRPGASPQTVTSKFTALLPRYLDAQTALAYHPQLQPLTDIHLYSHLFREINANADVMHLYIFSGIAILILLISSINFINLSTARALMRVREVGVRKSTGAQKSQLVIQFLSESMLQCLLALGIAALLLVLGLPSFNSILNKHLELSLFGNNYFSLTAAIVTVLTAILAGSYPAFFLARLRPSEVLKGTFKIAGKNRVREGLVAIQFAISAFLVIGSVIIFKQMNFVLNKQMGFDPSALVTVPIQDNAIRQKSETLKEELLSDPSILGVSFSGNQPSGGDWGIPYVPEGIDANQIPAMRLLAVDYDFVKTFDMKLADGRDFSKSIISDSSAYIINEEAARQLGWTHPIGKLISMPAVGRPQAPVVGVLKDFHFRSLKEKIGPVMLFIPPSGWMSVCTIRVKTTDIDKGLKAIEKNWASIDPGHPFTYTFFDETVGNLYQSERKLGELGGYFTFIGIFIACLGLFSLSAFVTEQRAKEVSIRKVLGASVHSIVLLLSKDLVKLVFVGFIVAVPASYYIMNQWLGAFAYKTEIGPIEFVVACVTILSLAWITVSFKVCKTGMANPVDSLKRE